MLTDLSSLFVQFKVTKNDQIMVEKLDADVQTKIILDKVLLLGTKFACR